MKLSSREVFSNIKLYNKVFREICAIIPQKERHQRYILCLSAISFGRLDEMSRMMISNFITRTNYENLLGTFLILLNSNGHTYMLILSIADSIKCITEQILNPLFMLYSQSEYISLSFIKGDKICDMLTRIIVFLEKPKGLQPANLDIKFAEQLLGNVFSRKPYEVCYEHTSLENSVLALAATCSINKVSALIKNRLSELFGANLILLPHKPYNSDYECFSMTNYRIFLYKNQEQHRWRLHDDLYGSFEEYILPQILAITLEVLNSYRKKTEKT